MQQYMVQNRKQFPGTHFFIHKGKQYLFNLELFKTSSNYFAKNPDQIKPNKYIKLLDELEEEEIDIKEDTINNFIQYIERQPIPLTNENVVLLNYLSHKYELPELIEHTEQYIFLHHSELALDQLILNRKNNKFNQSTYEDIISAHFLDYIENDRLLNLNVCALYRIIQKYQPNNNTDSIDKVIRFLIKCLDKYGRPASVLFSLVEFDETKIEYLNILVTKYSKIVDFHFLNSNLLSSIYEQTNKIICGKFVEDERYKEALQKLAETERVNSELKNEIETLKKKQEDQERNMNEMSEKIEQMKTDHQSKIDELVSEMNVLKRNQTELAQMKLQMEQVKTSHQNKIDELVSEMNRLKRKKAEMMEEHKNFKRVNIIDVPYSQSQSNIFNGILTRLGNNDAMKSLSDGIIDIKASSINGSFSSHQPKNILNYNDNNGSFHSKDEVDSWICIDFKNCKVKPSHYSLRSNGWRGKGHWHPQTWDLEGSNDFNVWDKLDSHSSDKCLDDKSVSKTFQISQGNQNKFYKYLRIKQKDKNTANDYCLIFSALEFYGQIKEQ